MKRGRQKLTGRDFTFQQSRKFWHRDDLTLQEKATYAMLCSYADASGHCWPSKPQLAKALGCSLKTMEGYVRTLKEKGVLTWEHVRDEFGHIRNRYTVTAKAYGKNLPVGSNQKKLPVSQPPISSCITVTKEQQIRAGLRPEDEEQSPFS